MLSEFEKKITVNLKEENGFDGELIYGRYSGIGIVMDSYYLDEGTGHGGYLPDNPTGFRTGQCLKVEVTQGVVIQRGIYKQGEIVDNICSYGGDVGIIGKPQKGDIVGFYLGCYVQIWEKVESTYLPKSTSTEFASTFRPNSLIDMELYKQASDSEITNAEKALILYEKLEGKNSKFHIVILLAGIIGFVTGYIVNLFVGQFWGIERDSLLLILIWYSIGITVTLIFSRPIFSSIYHLKNFPKYLYLPYSTVLSVLMIFQVPLTLIFLVLISIIIIYFIYYATYAIISILEYFFFIELFSWVLFGSTHPTLDMFLFAVCFTFCFLFLIVFDVGLPKALSLKQLFRVIKLKKGEAFSHLVLIISLILLFNISWIPYYFYSYSYYPFDYNPYGGVVFSVITGGLFGLAFARREKDLIVTNFYRLAKTRCLIHMNHTFETSFPLRYIHEDLNFIKRNNIHIYDILVNMTNAIMCIIENKELQRRQTLFKHNPWGFYIGSVVSFKRRVELTPHKEFLSYIDYARKMSKSIKHEKYYDFITDNIDKTEQLWLSKEKL